MGFSPYGGAESCRPTTMQLLSISHSLAELIRSDIISYETVRSCSALRGTDEAAAEAR
jgi:hypothetical protein